MSARNFWKACLAIGVAGLLVTGASASAKHNVVVYDFAGGSDGNFPYGGLVRDSSGNLYGTTGNGGLAHCGGGCGTLFRLAPNGTHTVLHDFTGKLDGAYPSGDLVADANGDIYGTTILGDTSGGSVFKLSHDGSFSVLHTFDSQTEGRFPGDRLSVAANGDVYGTTATGGAHGAGSIFKIAANGTFTTLYAFRDQEDGREAYGGIVADADGNLYGTTQYGGATDCGCGILFKLAGDGSFTVLHAFNGRKDGGQPVGPLLATPSGIVGTTIYYGAKCSCGVIFRVSFDGDFSVLHSFQKKEGKNPHSGLAADSDGNLYGAALSGGGCAFIDQGCGTIYELGADGTFTVLHKFSGPGDGYGPTATPLLSGLSIYGAAQRGGNSSCGLGCGTIYRLRNRGTPYAPAPSSFISR